MESSGSKSLVNPGQSPYILYMRFNIFYLPSAGCENPSKAFLIQGTVFAAPIPPGLPWGSISAGTPLTDRLTPGTLGFDLLPGRLLLALRRWMMGVPC